MPPGPYLNPINKPLIDALTIIRRAQQDIVRDSNPYHLHEGYFILEDIDLYLSEQLAPFDEAA